MQSSFKLGLVQLSDLPEIEALQYQVYAPFLHESLATFAHKLAMHPATTWMLRDKHGRLQAYLFSQTVSAGCPPVLNEQPAFRSALIQPDTLHLHDLAVHPSARNKGLGRMLTENAFNFAHQAGLKQASLIAVQNSVPFWRARGFTVREAPEALPSYGDDAAYMLKTL